MAYRRTSKNVQELGIRCSIPSADTTLSGLYLIKPIDMEKAFKPSEELKKYMTHARELEAFILDNRKRSMEQLDWN